MRMHLPHKQRASRGGQVPVGIGVRGGGLGADQNLFPLAKFQNLREREEELNEDRGGKTPYWRMAARMTGAWLVSLGLAGAGIAYGEANASEKGNPKDKDEVSFSLVPIPQFVDCLRANRYEEPKARATVVHGKQNDTCFWTWMA